jgi:acetyl-CoA carboxylase biotin carboxyl carrier protein
MRTNNTARLSAIPAPAGETGEVTEADVLGPLRHAVLTLLAGFHRVPKSLRIRAHQVEIEVEWPEHEAGAAQPGTVVPAELAELPAAADREYVTAQNVGVFYRSPEPGAKPFVELGDVVTAGQQVGIIEAMKLMIPVEAGAAGEIVDVIASDGAPVEYGEQLFAIVPAGG